MSAPEDVDPEALALAKEWMESLCLMDIFGAPDPLHRMARAITALLRERDEANSRLVQVLEHHERAQKERADVAEAKLRERDEEIERLKGQRDRLHVDALGELAAAGVCTPEEGFIKYPPGLPHAIQDLRKRAEAAEERAQKAEAALRQVGEALAREGRADVLKILLDKKDEALRGILGVIARDFLDRVSQAPILKEIARIAREARGE